MRTKQPRNVDHYVGARIRRRRIELNMTQVELGYKIGVSFQQVQKYEKGVNRVGGSRLAQIANELQVPPGYFFDGGPGVNGAPVEPDRYASALARRDVQCLLDKYLGLDDKRQEAIVRFLESF